MLYSGIFDVYVACKITQRFLVDPLRDLLLFRFDLLSFENLQGSFFKGTAYWN